MHRLYSAVIGLAVGLFASSAFPQTTAKYFSPVNESSPAGQAFAVFRAQVEKSTSGKVRFLSLPSAPATVLLKGLQDGLADIGMVSTLSLGQLDAGYQVFELPFLFGDVGAVGRFLNGAGGVVLKKRLRERGLEPLAVIDEGMSVGFTKKPIRSLGDLEGLKFATLTAEPRTASMLTAVNASVTRAAVRDVENMVTAGLVDGYFGPATVFSSKLQIPGLSIIPTRHAYIGFVLLASTKFIDGLPRDLRTAVANGAVAAEAEGKKQALDRLASLEARWRQAGIRVAPLPSAEISKWRTSAKPSWIAFDKSVGSDLLNLAISSTGGGGDPCPTLSECRCSDRTCSTQCCSKK